MYLIPLNQMESVEVLINSLRVAAGVADCTTCPAHKVCAKQCLMIAEAVDLMVQNNTLPEMSAEPVAREGVAVKKQESPEVCATEESEELPKGGKCEVLKFPGAKS